MKCAERNRTRSYTATVVQLLSIHGQVNEWSAVGCMFNLQQPATDPMKVLVVCMHCTTDSVLWSVLGGGVY